MMINELFKAIDSQDVNLFSSLLSADCRFRFANFPALTGVAEIENFVAGFFDSIDSLSHVLVGSWEVADGLVCHGSVSYTRKNGSVLTVPFANIFKMGSAGITEYLIFADTSQLYT